MQESKIELRSRIGRIAAAVGFALVVGSFAVGPARADNDHGGDRNRGSDQHRDNDNRGYRGGGRGEVYAAQPDYYYAPQPNYYAAPDPYYYNSGPSYDTPPQGVNLFFGL
jgi:hypothetical protein